MSAESMGATCSLLHDGRLYTCRYFSLTCMKECQLLSTVDKRAEADGHAPWRARATGRL